MRYSPRPPEKEQRKEEGAGEEGSPLQKTRAVGSWGHGGFGMEWCCPHLMSQWNPGRRHDHPRAVTLLPFYRLT